MDKLASASLWRSVSEGTKQSLIALVQISSLASHTTELGEIYGETFILRP